MRDKVIWEWILLAGGLLTLVAILAGGAALFLLADGWLRWVGIGLLAVFAANLIYAFVAARKPPERFNAYDDFRPYR